MPFVETPFGDGHSQLSSITFNAFSQQHFISSFSSQTRFPPSSPASLIRFCPGFLRCLKSREKWLDSFIELLGWKLSHVVFRPASSRSNTNGIGFQPDVFLGWLTGSFQRDSIGWKFHFHHRWLLIMLKAVSWYELNRVISSCFNGI